LCFRVIEYDSEFKIWLPFFVIENSDWDQLFSLSFTEIQNLVDWLEFRGCFGSVFNRSDTKSEIGIFLYVLNNDINASWALSNGVCETFEMNTWVLRSMIAVSASVLIAQLANLSFDAKKVFCLCYTISLLGSKSFEKWVWLKLLMNCMSW
jgi:hypothetical protein